MTDFESKLRASLRDHADEAPLGADLAGGARRRLRRRRTAMATAAVAAVVAIGAPFAFLDRDPASTGEVATDPPSPTAVERTDGLRTESWYDVTFEVPGTWGIGGTSGYCAGGATPQEATPTVGRPDDVTPAIACNPANGYGVTVGPAELYESASGDVYPYSATGNPEPRYPDGTWVSIWYDDEVAVTIATPDRALTEQILGSVKEFEDVDANGCGAKLGFAESATGDGTESLAVCRYDEADDLEWSRGLDAEQGQRLEAALEAAPVRSEATTCDTPDQTTGRTIVLTGGGYTATVLDTSSCEADNGIYYSDAVRELTDDVRAALERPIPSD